MIPQFDIKLEAAAAASYRRHFGARATEAAEADVLGMAMEALGLLEERITEKYDWARKWAPEVVKSTENADMALLAVRATLAINGNHLKSQITKAIDIAVKYGGIDGDHHKRWVIDQMVRALAGERYDEVVRDAKHGEDGPDTYEWDEGIAP